MKGEDKAPVVITTYSVKLYKVYIQAFFMIFTCEYK